MSKRKGTHPTNKAGRNIVLLRDEITPPIGTEADQRALDAAISMIDVDAHARRRRARRKKYEEHGVEEHKKINSSTQFPEELADE